MIKTVAKISQANAEILRNQEYTDGAMFNPIQDADGNWIITLQEAQYLDKSEIYFSTITFKPEIIEL